MTLKVGVPWPPEALKAGAGQVVVGEDHVIVGKVKTYEFAPEQVHG